MKHTNDKHEKATFAAGCFWGVEKIIKAIDGVISTVVGYSGGNSNSPTYEEVCAGKTGHAEAIEILFDPSKITYEELLEYFWRLHDPTQVNRQGGDIGTQYRSVIFYHDVRQREIAENSKAAFESSGVFENKIATEIIEAGRFYPAEDYHQDYLEKNPDGYMCHILRRK